MLRELEAAIEDIHNSDVGWIDVLVCMCGGGGSVLVEVEVITVVYVQLFGFAR